MLRSSISADSATLVVGELARALGDALLELLLRDAQRLLPVEQLDEHRDLRSQHVGRHRLDQIVDGADGVAAEDVLRAPVVGGQEDDRRLPRSRPLANQRRRLVAVDAGHDDVEQDQREVLIEDFLQRLPARSRANQAVARIAQDRLDRHQVLVAVVDDEDVDGFPHRDSHTRSSEIS